MKRDWNAYCKSLQERINEHAHLAVEASASYIPECTPYDYFKAAGERHLRRAVRLRNVLSTHERWGKA